MPVPAEPEFPRATTKHMNFILKMAWRDTRASRRRLLLFSLAIVLGVAALVAVGSLRDNLRAAIDEQTKGLLGADLVVNSRSALTPEAERYLAELTPARAREISFNSMLTVPGEQGGTRLVQVRAVEAAFPYYGEFLTSPAGARAELNRGAYALVEENLMVQYGLRPGDRIRLGEGEFVVAGGVLRVPGESIAVTMLAPRVYIPFETVGATGLLQQGSLARHRVYLKFPATTDVEALVRAQRERFRGLRLGIDTVEERKRNLGAAMRNVNSFLSLVGFAALFLGAIGVGSAIHAHIRQKVPVIAVLRCVGATARTSFAIYLVQGLGLGLLGAGLGALLGIAAQLALPPLVREFLPFQVEFFVSWAAVARGVGAGVLTSLLFALLPLLEVRKVSPLVTLRSAFGTEPARRADPGRVVVLLLIVGLVFAFAIAQAGRWQWGVGFALALLAGFGVLGLVAQLVAWLAKRFTPRGLPFAWRQGVSNLHRPNNRTVLLLVSLGMGTFLILTLYLMRGTLLAQLTVSEVEGRPNLMLFDIQDDQTDGLRQRLRAAGAPPLQAAPVVTMRVAALRGRPVAELLRDRSSGVAGWTLRREYRSTYRGELTDTEKILSGRFVGAVPAGTGRVPISIEEGLARDMHAGLGDEIDFDVQGVVVPTYVASIRQVEWQRLQPNFFIVFPTGVLESAPKFHIFALRVATPADSARVQQLVVREFPNVSAIDLGLVLQTFDNIFSKASFVVEFMALFTVVTGVIVLAGAVLIGRHQRIRESVLLRTLGATRQQVNRIMLAEYLALGTLGAAVGAILSIGGTWLLARHVFEMPFVLAPGVLVAGWAAVSAVTVATGLLASRGICDHPPLEVLREET